MVLSGLNTRCTSILSHVAFGCGSDVTDIIELREYVVPAVMQIVLSDITQGAITC